MKLKDKFTAILRGDEKSPPYFFALAPLGWAYACAVRMRASMYSSGVLRRRRLPCSVVSVGNITAGGTGKTPMVALVARLLKDMGLKVSVVTRGYGGTMEGETLVVSDGARVELDASQSGDEPALLARLLPGVPVVMGADRYAAGMLAVDRFGPDAVVLDDGFQHMALHRDLDILLTDALRPFGNGRVLPAGYLREPASAAERADIVVLTRSDRADAAALEESAGSVSRFSGGRPIAVSRHEPSAVRAVWDGEERPPEYLSGKRVFGFCGIADPASFALILDRLNAKIVGLKGFSDHHAYTASELETLDGLAKDAGSELLATTEKDAVKLEGLPRTGIELLSVGVELKLTEGEGALENLLKEKVLKA